MEYCKESINDLSQEVATYEIFLEYEHGVVESPFKKGKILRALKCSQLDAWIISESMNIERNGIISERDSWEGPRVCYRKINV